MEARGQIATDNIEILMKLKSKGRKQWCCNNDTYGDLILSEVYYKEQEDTPNRGKQLIYPSVLQT